MVQIGMKNRNIPFGYQYENGCIVLAASDSAIVKEIYAGYIGGSSMLNIARSLNERKVEYLPGITGWNKARIKRIIEDERYLGTESYPQIITQESYDAIQSIKSSRNTQRDTDRRSEIYQLAVPVYCPVCGMKMKRRTDIRCTVPQRWACKKPECKTLIMKSDKDLLAEITALMNQVIAKPEQVYIAADQVEPSIETRKAKNEVGRMLDTAGFDKDLLRSKLFECVSLRYGDLDSKPYIAKRLKAVFEQSSLLSEFSAELFGRTVKSLHLEADGNVSITLLNDQRIRKEQPHDTGADGTAAKSGAVHSAHH